MDSVKETLYSMQDPCKDLQRNVKTLTDLRINQFVHKIIARNIFPARTFEAFMDLKGSLEEFLACKGFVRFFQGMCIPQPTVVG